jgi:hypothetical protein
MTIDITKNYRTRDGREVRIYATDGGGGAPVHGAIKNGFWSPWQWMEHGSSSTRGTNGADLIEVRPRIKREVWVNVYPTAINPDIMAHPTKFDADRFCASRRLACIPITIDCAEGDGL